MTTVACTCEGKSGMRFGGEHTTDCAKWLAEFYPDGRTFYDESDDREAFIKTCHAMGLTVSTHQAPPEAGLEPWTTVYVPAKKLGDFYALDLRVGT